MQDTLSTRPEMHYLLKRVMFDKHCLHRMLWWADGFTRMRIAATTLLIQGLSIDKSGLAFKWGNVSLV